MGSTTLKYQLRAPEDLHLWLMEMVGWVPLTPGSPRQSWPDGAALLVAAQHLEHVRADERLRGLIRLRQPHRHGGGNVSHELPVALRRVVHQLGADLSLGHVHQPGVLQQAESVTADRD